MKKFILVFILAIAKTGTAFATESDTKAAQTDYYFGEENTEGSPLTTEFEILERTQDLQKREITEDMTIIRYDNLIDKKHTVISITDFSPDKKSGTFSVSHLNSSFVGTYLTDSAGNWLSAKLTGDAEVNGKPYSFEADTTFTADELIGSRTLKIPSLNITQKQTFRLHKMTAEAYKLLKAKLDLLYSPIIRAQ